MSAFYPIQANFSKGELTPLAGARDDIDFWRQSLAECLNFEVLMHGGIRRRSGTLYVGEVVDSDSKSRIFPFEFSTEQSYVVEFSGAGQTRFYALRGRVMDGPSPYQISHGYAEANLWEISWTHFNDITYQAHDFYAPAELRRLAETDWQLIAHVFNDGPWLPMKPLETTLTPSGRGGIIPFATSNSVAGSTIALSNGAATAYVLFDGDLNTSFAMAAEIGWVSITFPVGVTKVVDKYWLSYPSYGGGVPVATDAAPSSWVIEGYNGTAWIGLDEQSEQLGWNIGEKRYFSFQNETAYEAYRFRWKGTNGNTLFSMAEILFNESGPASAPITLTASSAVGINDGSGFIPNDVGRLIRLKGSDSVWRWARILTRISALQVTVRLSGYVLPDISPISQWQLGAYGTRPGWPNSVALFDERLFWGANNAQPVTVNGSKQGNFGDHGISSPMVPTDAVSVTLLSSNMNKILWIADDEDLVCGSSKQVRTVGPSDTTVSFSATNVTQRKGPNSGASRLRPLNVGSTLLYVGAGGTKIRELVRNEQGRYVAPELSILGEHLFRSPIVDWDYREIPEPVIYAVTEDGNVATITYDRDQRVVGVSRFNFGGAVESVAVIPGIEDGYHDVYFVIRRTVNAVQKRYIEVLDRAFIGDKDTIEDAHFVDCGVVYNGPAVTVITGLGHLEGEAARVLADGNVINGLTVTGGSITLPYPVTTAHIGLAYTSRAVTHPVTGPQQDGSLFGRRVNVTGMKLNVLDSAAMLKKGQGLFGSKIDLVTGIVSCEMEGDWMRSGGSVLLETDDPLPLLVRGIIPQIEAEP
jgi:hypothetical protein